MPDEPLLEGRALHKRFGPVDVLHGVDFRIAAGEIQALLGENGAGKSTLVRILAGIHPPSGGTLREGGREVAFRSPADAQRAGIALIHQELPLLDDLDVAGNIFLGRESRRQGCLIDRARLRMRAAEILARLGVAIDPGQPAGTLRIGERQCVEIARALSQDLKVLILDEPTSALSPPEVRHLIDLLRTLSASGTGIVLITHKLEEVFTIADRITVLRDGNVVLAARSGDVTRDEVVKAMIGRSQTSCPTHPPAPLGRIRLGVEELALGPLRRGGRDRLSGVSFDVREGEIVGLAGLLGAGRTEILEGLDGAYGRGLRGRVTIDGTRIGLRSPKAAARNGIVLVTEDRSRTGIVHDLDLEGNVFLAAPCSRGGLIDRRSEARRFADVRSRFALVAPDSRAAPRTLSGGNQQKLLIARAMERRPRVLLLDDPTRGVDVKAKEEIHALIKKAAAEGLAILLASSELPELLDLSDRILILRSGKIVAEKSRVSTDAQDVLRVMAG